MIFQRKSSTYFKTNNKLVAVLLIALITISSLGVLAEFAKANTSTHSYTIGITTINGVAPENGPFSSPINLVGTATGTSFIGVLSQYHVQVDWGDGVIETVPTWTTLTQSDVNFAGTWAWTHYYNRPGSFDITIKLYHTQSPGAGGTSDAVYSALGIDISSITRLSLSLGNPQVIGTSLMATASVLPSDATGNVQFQVQAPGSNNWNTYSTIGLSSGSVISTPYILSTIGTYTFRAIYNGDLTYRGSISLEASITANPTLIVSIDPISSTMNAGQTQTFTAIANYGSGTYANYVWYVDSVDVQSGADATYVYTPVSSGLHNLLVVVTDTLGNTASSTPTIVTVNADSATHFVVSATSSATAGQSFPVTVTAKDQYENTVSGYSGIVHLTSSDNQAILPTDSTLNGGAQTFSITLMTAGSQTITATDTSDASITRISDPILVNANFAQPITLVISPSSNSITAGGSQTYTAELFDLYHNSLGDVTNSVAWKITADEGAYIWTGNSVQVNKAGDWTVTASYAEVPDATTLLHVTGHLAPTTIRVTPRTQTIAAGNSQEFTAMASDGYNIWEVTNTVTWSIDNAAGGIWAGPTYTSESAGTWQVTASISGLSDATTLTVTANSALLHNITIAPLSQTIAAGQTQSYRAIASDSFGNTWDVTTDVSVADGWTISNGAGGSWSGATYTSEKAGTWTVTAARFGYIATASLTVTHATDDAYLDQIAITPQASTIAAGIAQFYTAIAKDSFGNSWTVNALYSCPSTNVIITGNSVTSNTAGSYTITGTFNGKSDTASLTVTGHLPTVLTLLVSPKTASISAGVSQAFIATASDGFNIWDVTNQVAWSILESDDQGLWNQVTGNYTSAKAGTWTVQATLNGISDSATLIVQANAQLLDHIAINPKTSSMTVGSYQPYSVTAYDQFGNSLGDVTFSTVFAAPGALISGASVSAVSAGNYIVTATYMGKSDAATLSVAADPITTKAPATYNFTFTQTGLPTGKSWTATFNGQTQSSTNSTIIFSGIQAGDYSWTISNTIKENNSTQYLVNGTNTAKIYVPSVTTQNIRYITQFYLTINSTYGSTTGQGWYNAGSVANFSIGTQGADNAGIQYAFTNWAGTGSGSYSGTETNQTVTMGNPITETANWEQFTTLFSVAESAIVILIMLLVAFLLLALRRRKNKEEDKKVASPSTVKS